MIIDINQSVPVSQSYRAARVRSLFNVTPEQSSTFSAHAEIPADVPGWSIGLVVGPSGSGKSSIGRNIPGFAMQTGHNWFDFPIIDEIAPGKPFDAVTGALSAVGLGSCPSWLRPYSVLSTGEKFRADLARTLLDDTPNVVIDEFTSVVDRQIARIGAHAFAKAWRRQKTRRVVLLSCHRDIIDWLCPDWYLDTEDMSLHWGSHRRPPIEITISQTNWSPWPHFEPHHYLKLPHMIAATNYIATSNGEPAAHVAVSTTVGLKTARMCRLVVMPEWQGAGVGLRFINAVADMWLRGDNRYSKPMTTIFHTSHPGLAAALRRRPEWLYGGGRLLGESGVDSRASMAKSHGCTIKSNYGGHMRAVQSFRYVGGAA